MVFKCVMTEDKNPQHRGSQASEFLYNIQLLENTYIIEFLEKIHSNVSVCDSNTKYKHISALLIRK